MLIKKICCIGAGYVGGPTMAVFANNCPDIKITVLDLNKEKIAQWNDKDLNKLPIFEPGLEEIIRNRMNKAMSSKGKTFFWNPTSKFHVKRKIKNVRLTFGGNVELTFKVKN